MTELIDSGLWASLSPSTRAVFGVVWDFHRKYPDTCRPSRATIARLAGVSPATVTRSLPELEKTGLLKVIPASGPGTNTYKIRWSDLKVHGGNGADEVQASPYTLPKPDVDEWLPDGPSPVRRVFRERQRRGYRMPDGCVLHSAREVVVHQFLVEWGVPHWPGVPYHQLGIKGLKDSAKVDFVIGPRLILEVWGLTDTESRHRRYMRSRRRKESAVEASAWNLIGLEPDEDPEVNLIDPILEHWASSSRDEASGFAKVMSRAGKWLAEGRSEAILKSLARDADDRRAGRKPPAEPRGLWVDEPNPGGPPIRRRVKPVIVLEASANVTDIDGLLD